jgi:BlaI family penicillinase repressor
MPESPCPADGELAILRVPWDHQPCSVREVHDVIAATKLVGYTTILKTMQIMADKGLVRRDERHKAHLCRSALPAPRVFRARASR